MRRAVSCAVAAVILVVARPTPALLLGFVHPLPFVRNHGVDGAAVAVATTALWLVALRVALSVLLLQAARLPGRAGRAGRRAAVTMSPRLLRPVLLGTIGVGAVCGSTVAAAAAAPGPAGRSVPAIAGSLPSPAWPTDPVGHRGVPATPPPGRDGASASRARTHRTGTTGAGTTGAGSVTVRPGDSLWRIAAEALPGSPTEARIARAWPRWYAANARVVGDDPNLIRPGQVLRPPSSGRTRP